MARRDAILRLHHRLVAQRDDLRKKLSAAAVDVEGGAGTSNLGDVANDDAERDVNTQLASTIVAPASIAETPTQPTKSAKVA